MIPIITSQEAFIQKLCTTPKLNEDKVLAWYEHRLGCIAKTPRLLLMPIDDHLVHRGDGVFESIKYWQGKIIGLDTHLDRLQRSANTIFLSLPCSMEELREIILQTVYASERQEGMLRVLLGRGPGGFDVDPFESPEASLYVIAYELADYSRWYEQGLRGVRTSIPPKQGQMVQVKSSNYLPNVLMMREARIKEADVPFSYTAEGILAESAIANICFIDKNDVFSVPSLTNSLKGTTLTRAMRLLEGTMECQIGLFYEEDVLAAKEVMILGTGPECAPVVMYEGKPIGVGTPGPVCAMLRERIFADQLATGVSIPKFIT